MCDIRECWYELAGVRSKTCALNVIVLKQKRFYLVFWEDDYKMIFLACLNNRCCKIELAEWFLGTYRNRVCGNSGDMHKELKVP